MRYNARLFTASVMATGPTNGKWVTNVSCAKELHTLHKLIAQRVPVNSQHSLDISTTLLEEDKRKTGRLARDYYRLLPISSGDSGEDIGTFPSPTFPFMIVHAIQSRFRVGFIFIHRAHCFSRFLPGVVSK